MNITDLPFETALPEGFWVRVDANGPVPEHAPELGNCWQWIGTVLNEKHPYGRFLVGSRTDGTRKRVQAHRLSLKDATGVDMGGLDVDHLCSNKRCVRPDHLRAATRSENASNRKGANANSGSGVRGVYWNKKMGKWAAQSRADGKHVHLGYFGDPDEAAAAVSKHRREHMKYSYMDQDPVEDFDLAA